ncbi:hypothetical protein ACNFJ7_07450 [Sphingomonas sp. HT-1]|uniref:hypothetical protein n=1 Tax=unclassified Sphingomonas TaxID=196159 RepID=UPI0002E1DFEE|nr:MULTISPECIES: hypothetical protein [unclassified Sphingomonas]KTF68429.1 hypothetical protein ATB93_14015 [Sphingomonas sp. WG]
MKKILFLLVVLIAGLGIGGGAAYAMVQMLGIGAAAAHAEVKEEKAEEPTRFVPTGRVLAPLVFADGRLAGYAAFEVQLEVDEAKADYVTTRLPLLLHAINMRTYRTPLAAGPDGMLPNLDSFRTVVDAAATEAFGAKAIRKVAVTAATPA